MKFFKKKPTALVGDNHEIVINKKSKKLIIFFTGTGAKKGEFFFYGVGKKLNANVLFINNSENKWYQEGIPSLGTNTLEETIVIIKKWIEYLDISKTYTCGASMGAYGAMLYGSFLDTRVLAFGPEIDLLEKGSRSIDYIKENQTINYNLKEILKKSTNDIYIYAGEDDPIDVYQASKCASFIDFSNVNVYCVENVHHSVGAYLKRKNKLLEFIEDFLNDNKLSTIGESSNVCSINGFSEAYYWQYYHFKQKQWDKAIEFGEQATVLYQVGSYAQYMLGLSYVQTGDFSKGLTHLSMARSLVPLNLEYQHAVANCLRRMGHLAKARYLHQKILQVNKDFAKTHYDLSLIYSKMGDHKGAIARAKHALRVQPNNASFQKRVEKLTSKKKK